MNGFRGSEFMPQKCADSYPAYPPYLALTPKIWTEKLNVVTTITACNYMQPLYPGVKFMPQKCGDSHPFVSTLTTHNQENAMK